MRVFVTGATGVIGRHTIPRLLEAGHDVAGVARSDAGAGWLRAVGATPVKLDLFDPAMVHSALSKTDAVVQLATAIPPLARMRRPGAWHTNDRLRTEATRNLVDAAITAGVEVFVQESISFLYADGGAQWLNESAEVDPPFAAARSALVAEAETDRFASTSSGAVPPAYRLLEGFLWGQPNWALAIFIALTGLGLACYGAALLASGRLARWLGWTFVASGLLLTLSVVVIGDGPPEAVELPLLLGGVLALRQTKP